MNIAVLLATYNGEKYLEAQLNSLLNQTYSNFNVYISDDCSADSTQTVIDKYTKKFPDKFIDLHNRNRFANAKNNFFYLLENVNADLYFFCDQDDIWLPEKIEQTIQAYNSVKNKNQPILIHSDLQVVDSNMKTIAPSFFDMMKLNKNVTDWRNFVCQNYVTGCTMMINKVLSDVYRKNKNVVNTDNVLMHDYFFALLASLIGEIVFIDTPLVLYRQHALNSIGARNVNSSGFIIQKLLHLKECKDLILQEQIQVSEILKIIEKKQVNSETLSVLKNYSELYKQTKLKRIAFLSHNKLRKFGFRRRLFQTILT